MERRCMGCMELYEETLERCPHCGYGLYNVCGIMPSCCPNCGEDL